MTSALGVLAGGGVLPRRIVEACQKAERPVHVIAFEGITNTATVAGASHCWQRLGAVGATIKALKGAGAADLVLAGQIERPSFSSLKPDWRGMKLLPKLMAAEQGDDAILSIVLDELEGEGFRIVSVQDVLPDLLAQTGVIAGPGPSEGDEADIARGLSVLGALGAADVGQAAVVQQGIVLAVEAVDGTNAMLSRCREIKRDGGGGVLVKCSKPGQDMRVDMPTIGARTVEAVVEAGLAGIAVEAGSTLILDRARLIELADDAGVFVVGVDFPG